MRSSCPSYRQKHTIMARDKRGRFTKGNTEGRKFPTGGGQTETARKGGIASQAAARERKTLADTLRAALAENAGGGLTKQEYIVAKCLEGLAKGKCFPKDLKTLAEVLGELKTDINLHTEGEGITIKFADGDD